jgi:hypothetical protein
LSNTVWEEHSEKNLYNFSFEYIIQISKYYSIKEKWKPIGTIEKKMQ